MAAGAGMRLRPYTRKTPKVLFKVGGETLLARNLRMLDAAFALDVIYVVVGYRATEVREAAQSLAGTRARVEVVEVSEASIAKGLLGGYAAIAPLIDENEYFVCSLGDEYYGEDDHGAFAAALSDHPPYAACCAVKRYVFPEEYFKNYAVVFDDQTGLVEGVREKPQTIESPFFGLGLIAAHRSLAEIAAAECAAGSDTTLIDLLNRLRASPVGPVYGHVFNGDYVNINTRTDFYRALHAYRALNRDRFRIDVIMPAWNEAGAIENVVRDFRRVCDRVIVMDNESPDGTAEVARRAGADVYSQPLKGYGDAIRMGLEHATGDILIVTESDGTFRAEDVEKFLVFLMNCDAVIGTRTYWQYVEAGANMDFVQRWANILFGGIITALWWNRKSRFTDVGCTFRGMWREAYEQIRPRLISDGPGLSPEMIIELLNEWQRVIEVPVPYHARIAGESKFSRSFFHLARTALKMLWIILYKRTISLIENLAAVLRLD